jgi:hypothetical protein
VDVVPAPTLLGTSERPSNEVATMVIGSVRPTPPAVAMMDTDFISVTADVEILKLPILWPSGIVMLAGKVTSDASVVLSVTTVPPAGALLLISTVPMEVSPPASLLGSKYKFDGTALGVTRT